MTASSGTGGPALPLPLAQIRAYWHHWFMATARGQAFVREHGKAIAREKWDLCSPENRAPSSRECFVVTTIKNSR